jgi:hypothetical protein
MGIAVHNFHDSQGALPPLSVWIHKPGIHLFLFPYAEQQQLYNFVVDRGIFTCSGTSNVNGNYNYPYFPDGITGILQLTAEERNGFNVEWLRCPSTGLEPTNNYAAVTTYIVPLVFIGADDWTNSYRMTTDNASPHQSFGPFCAAEVTGEMTGDIWSDHNKIRTWKPREKTMATWQDGTSNQIIFAEKHIPQWARKTASDQAFSWNGSYLMSWIDYRAGGFARLVTNQSDLIAPSSEKITLNTQLPVDTSAQYFYGSYHSSTLNVLLGDGSVRGASKTIDTQIFYNNCHTSDGNSASLP